MRLLTLNCATLIICLTGCEQTKAKKALAADDTIVLECSGESVMDSKREPVSYIIKIHPGNQFQQSLHFYSDIQKRFLSPCEDRGLRCSLSVGSDLITEVGEAENNGQITLRKLTEINRRTGSMRVALESTLPLETVFEGQCIKGSMPPEEVAKF